MDRKTLPLIIFCILLFVGWGPLMDWIFGPSKPRPASNSTNHVATAQAPDAKTPIAPPPSTGILASTTALQGSAEKKALENEDFKVEFTSIGGAIERVTLKHFKENEKGVISLNEENALPVQALAIGDAPLRASYELTALSSNQLRAVHQSPAGLKIVKQFTLKPNYLIESSVTITNTGQTSLTNTFVNVSLGTVGPINSEDKGDHLQFSFHSKKTVHENIAAIHKHIQKQKKPFEKDLPLTWAGLRNQYFTVLTTPSIPFTHIEAESYLLPAKDPSLKVHKPVKDQKAIVATMRSPVLDLAPNASTNLNFQVYAGPMDSKRLSSLGSTQHEVMNLGMFEIFSKALLWLMDIFHGLFGNWGVAIIMVTVIIKIVFWPLTTISTRSMKQMQALSPQMNALKEKYKDDPKKMNEEVMKMYRDYKINPLAGCLPMLVQIPIFFAFYNLLQSAVELRGAPFMFWIHDLSRPDTVAYIPGLDFPINPLPLIMAVTMIWQTRIAPQAPNADPTMKMMVWLMPAMFLFFCYNFSSGLSLYWTAQNILTIIQTYLTKDKPVEPPKKVKAKGGFTFARPIDPKKK